MRIIITLFTLILCFSCQNITNQREGKTQEQVIEDSYIRLQNSLDSLHHIGIFEGFSGTIVDTSGILFNKGYGYADAETQQAYTENTIINIASVSKVFIGVALMKAIEMGLVNLDDPINKHLPFKVVHPDFADEIITVRQLATHTSSIVDTDLYIETCYINKDDVAIPDSLMEKYGTYYQNPSTKWMPLREYLNTILVPDDEFYDKETYASRKPGELYDYSNIGAALCGLVIESAAQQPFYEFTDKHIFKPLGMSSTSWLYEEIDMSRYSKLYADYSLLPYYKIMSYPDGGLITSSTDLGLFLIELIKGYSGNGDLLETASYTELYKPQLPESAFKLKPNRNEGFNVGLFLELEPAYHVIGHTGGDPGVNSFMYFNTQTGKGNILITNTDSEKENSNEVFYAIWNALGEAEE